MGHHIALEEETGHMNHNMYKKYFQEQMIAALFTRLTSTVMPPISAAALARMAS